MAASCKKEAGVERPIETWVFRSVLDDRPRMITAVLHPYLSVAYETPSASLYKAWNGGVLLDGAVYTTRHGPQPSSKGVDYLDETMDRWFFAEGDKAIEAQVEYRGHRIEDGTFTLLYTLRDGRGGEVKVEETPEYTRRGNQHGLVRKFRTEQKGDRLLAPRLALAVSSLMRVEDFESTANFVIQSQDSTTYADGSKSYRIAVLADLEDALTFKAFFHPNLSAQPDGSDAGNGAILSPAGLARKLIDENDCRTCHNEEVKTVGPSYKEVARKYGDDNFVVDMLVRRVIEGAVGVWGDDIMNAHPGMVAEDAATIVRYILALDDDAEDGESKHTLGEKSVPISLSYQLDSNDGEGLVVHYYPQVPPDFEKMMATLKERSPEKIGVVGPIHLVSDMDFGVRGNNFLFEVVGIMHIPQDDTYGFRLLSDDGSYLYVDKELQIDNSGLHTTVARDAEIFLKKGAHPIKILFYQDDEEAFLSLQLFNKEEGKYELVPKSWFKFRPEHVREVIPREDLVKGIPGDKRRVNSVHPSFTLRQARPENFEPRVGGIDFLSDGSMVLCTWDEDGAVYKLSNWQDETDRIEVKKIAFGLAEPLGIAAVDDTIYVLQKQELTKLVDTDGDGIIEEYLTVCDEWQVTSNFHEFAFGLVFKEGFFYGNLATAILPGGASKQPQVSDRGKVFRVRPDGSDFELIAHGLRTPNGIGIGVDDEIFISDNQGDWLPSSKIVHLVKGRFFGSRSVDPEGTRDIKEDLPVVWLPQNEIGNSPSNIAPLDVGPYAGQMIHGEITHGGIKRVYVEKVDGEYQGAVFRFIQGLEAAVNRISWANDSTLVAGGIGSSGNWQDAGKKWYGLQSLTYNDNLVFEMLRVKARANGFVVELTEAIGSPERIEASDFEVRSWKYVPTSDYGGPKVDPAVHPVKEAVVSEDRKTISLVLGELSVNRVFYIRIERPFVSESRKSLWSTEAWYTLNNLPGESIPAASSVPAHNALLSREEAQGWMLLFDGKTLEGIHNFNSASLGEKWVVDDGSLHFRGHSKGSEQTGGGDVVVTPSPVENFEFYVEWRVAKNGNSGIIYSAVESEEYEYPWLTGTEMQILDNTGHPDGRIVKHRAGDLYDLISCDPVTVLPAMRWNRAMVRAYKGHVEHFLNGYKVVSYDRGTEEWEQMIQGSKFAEMPDFAKSAEGMIVLQDHADKVWFRNIKLRVLDPESS